MYGRRNFIKNLLIGTVAANQIPSILAAKVPEKNVFNRGFASSQSSIRIALIGKGGMGTADTNTALSVGGINLVGVCDLYDR